MEDAAWEEVERMAQAASAADAQLAFEYPDNITLQRWEKLFRYSHSEATRFISDQRNDCT